MQWRMVDKKMFVIVYNTRVFLSPSPYRSYLPLWLRFFLFLPPFRCSVCLSVLHIYTQTHAYIRIHARWSPTSEDHAFIRACIQKLFQHTRAPFTWECWNKCTNRCNFIQCLVQELKVVKFFPRSDFTFFIHKYPCAVIFPLSSLPFHSEAWLGFAISGIIIAMKAASTSPRSRIRFTFVKTVQQTACKAKAVTREKANWRKDLHLE